jgi:large subunit ribosomal protein L22
MAKATTKTVEKEEKKDVRTATAVARHLHISPRKARLVADLIRGLTAAEAVTQLQILRKRASAPVLKVLLSAIANAESAHKLNKETLRVSKITVDQGPVMQRWQPRAYGRAATIRKPTSHIFVEVFADPSLEKADKKPFFPTIVRRPKKVKPEQAKQEKNGKKVTQTTPTGESKISAKYEEKESQGRKEKKGFLGFRKNILNRKGGEK